MYDLTGFQRDILYVITGLDKPWLRASAEDPSKTTLSK